MFTSGYLFFQYLGYSEFVWHFPLQFNICFQILVKAASVSFFSAFYQTYVVRFNDEVLYSDVQ